MIYPGVWQTILGVRMLELRFERCVSAYRRKGGKHPQRRKSMCKGGRKHGTFRDLKAAPMGLKYRMRESSAVWGRVCRQGPDHA